MCGIVGVSSSSPNVCLSINNALTVLQHRGQDAAGMAVANDKDYLSVHKGNGLVRDVFSENEMLKLIGNIGVGHVRYPTAGTTDISEAQPFYVNSPFGLVLVHNGNLVNTEQLRKELLEDDNRHLNTESDSEILLNVFAKALHQYSDKNLNEESISKAVNEVHNRIQGAYSVIIMILGYGMVAFRDPNGIRPLVYGEKNNNNYMIASESVALDCLGYDNITDVKPGETVIIKPSGELCKYPYTGISKIHNPCIFEYVYLARPDSVIDGINVYESRLSMGRKLGKKIIESLTKEELDDIDVIIPIPDTSRTSAVPLSLSLGKDYREGFVKNRYIGRTFIMPGQKIRKKSVKQKLNTIKAEFENKNVLLVDDSIVRGNTSKQIVQMARDAGAKKVYFASASPPIRYQNVYGIDMPFVEDLVAYDKDIEQINKVIGADKLIYQDLEDLIDAVKECGVNIDQFDCSCFNGEYITDGVDNDYLNNLANNRKRVE